MEMQVTVHDKAGGEIGKTFSRRARQLVSSSRAVWLDEKHTAIRLISSGLKEDTKMETRSVTGETQQYAGYTVADSHEETDSLYSKDTLLKLARKKVMAKRKLRRHIIIYIVAFFFSICTDLQYEGEFLFGVFLTWGIFLMRDVASYFLPFIKNGGIKSFFRHSYRDPVEAEYRKLKRMEPERIAAEFNRL